MAWTKIPEQNHPLFMSALPKDPRISTVKMFGGLAGMVNGKMFSGLFARSAVVKLSEPDQRKALALDGSAPFDPMGNGRVMKDTVLLAEEVMDDPRALGGWLRRSFEHALTLPPKQAKRPAPAKAATRPAAKAAIARTASKPAKAAAKPARKAAAKPASKAAAAAAKQPAKRKR